MSKDNGTLTPTQRDALLMAQTERERWELRKKIREHGEHYDPVTDWWPNKYPDM